MQIKTTDGEKNVASQGVGVSGLTLGIIGTSLALLNGGNNGCGCNGGSLLSNLFGRGGNCGCASTSHDTRIIGALEAELAKEKAERYADSIGIATFKEAKAMSDKNDAQIQANYKELAQFVAQLDKQIAVDKQATQDNFAFLNNRIDEKARELRCYVDATFVPGVLKMPLDSICPEAMRRYNSWTAPTTTAPAAEAATASN